MATGENTIHKKGSLMGHIFPPGRWAKERGKNTIRQGVSNVSYFSPGAGGQRNGGNKQYTNGSSFFPPGPVDNGAGENTLRQWVMNQKALKFLVRVKGVRMLCVLV